MFDTINGIPVHPLVVHAIVVLLPLAILGTVLIVIKPSWRLTYGPLVVLAALVTTVLLPVATESGEALEDHVGEPGGEHAELGESLIWFAIPLLILVALLVYLAYRAASTVRTADGTPTGQSSAVKVVAVLAIVAAVAAGVQVYRVGDSGARSAWEDQVSSGS